MEKLKFRYVYSNGKEIKSFIYTIEEIEEGNIPYRATSWELHDFKLISRDRWTGIFDSTKWENRPSNCELKHPSEWKGIEIYERDLIEIFGNLAEVKFINQMFMTQEQVKYRLEPLSNYSSPAYKIISNTHQEAIGVDFLKRQSKGLV